MKILRSNPDRSVVSVTTEVKDNFRKFDVTDDDFNEGILVLKLCAHSMH